MASCREVWPAAPSKHRPELRCEYDEHGPDRYHFDGTYEVSWQNEDGKRTFVGADPFHRHRGRR